MSNLVERLKVNPVFLKERINLYNPIWYANHLSKEDRALLCDNVKEVLKESDKIGTTYTCAENKLVDDTRFNRVEGPFSYVRNIVRYIEDAKGTKVQLFRDYEVEKRKGIIPIASDYVHMVNEFYRNSDPEVTQLVNFNAILALSLYEFTSINDFIGIINAAGSIVGMKERTTLCSLFEGIRVTLNMLKDYLLLTEKMYDKNILIIEFEDIDERMRKLEDVEAYLCGDTLSNSVEHAHVVTYLTNVIGLYCICNNTNLINSKDLISDISHGYLYKRIERFYYSEREELSKLLDKLVNLTVPSEGDNKLVMSKLNDEYNKELILSEKEMGEDEPSIHISEKNPMDNLTFKEKVEIEELYKIKREDIEKAIIDKIKVREGSFEVKKLSDISEELLAMYMAEFNEYRPLFIFEPFDRYFIKWDNKFFILFQLGSLNDDFKDLSNCLYAIRIDTNGDSEKYYDLIQMKKSNSVKYVFEY